MAVIIVGGGIVGLTLANLLAQQTNIPITIIDKQPPILVWDQATYDLRCSAINAFSQQTLQKLDIWPKIVAQRYGYYEQMIVWDDLAHNNIKFVAAELGVKQLGFIVENRLMQRELYQRLNCCKRVQIIFGEITGLTFSAEKVNLTVNNVEINAELIVGADGANSWLRQQLAIATSQKNYQQRALVATVETEFAHNNIAMQRFFTTGNLAFLPLDQEKLCSIVWVSSPECIENLLKLSPEAFCKELAITFDYKLGGLNLRDQPLSFPLQYMDAVKYVVDRAVLIGDAAHVIHPMAGQGLNLGLKDAVTLANVLAANSEQQRDLADPVMLRKYERQCKSHNLIMLQLVDKLNAAFRNQNTFVRLFRTNGIRLLNNLSFMKRHMVEIAMGIS